MEELKTKLTSAGAAGGLFLSLALIASLLFFPSLQKKEKLLSERRSSLAHQQQMIADRANYEWEWELYKNSFDSKVSGEAMMNSWIKELLAYSSSQQLLFTKLEPQGIRKKGSVEEARLYAAFRGDIRKFSGLLYYLKESDPLSRVESFAMKKEDGEPGVFFYEITLARSLR